MMIDDDTSDWECQVTLVMILLKEKLVYVLDDDEIFQEENFNYLC